MSLLILALIVGSCVGCGAVVGRTVQRAGGRTASEQRAAVVLITVRCPDGNGGRGSGVLIDGRHVLTAAHVVTIPDAVRESCPSIEIIAYAQDGVGRRMRIAMIEHHADLARLEIADDAVFPKVRPLKLALSGEGAHVCAMPAAPIPDRRCGQVEEFMRGRSGDNLWLSLPVERGNSGSGVYDSRGYLVGIITRQRVADNGQITGGIATAVGGLSWLLGQA